MTAKIYYDNPYLQEFEATVQEVITTDEGIQVILDKTAFYPLGGGQSADHGSLEGFEVHEVTEKQDTIFHHLKSGNFTPGQTVRGVIDWKRRFDHMQQHSGEHILSGIAWSLYQKKNVGFEIGEDIMRIDYDSPLTEQELQILETKANEVIRSCDVITASFPDRAELESLPYRSKKELAGDIRIVNVSGTDICACCGTHVTRTAEVGALKILSATSHRGGVRLEVVCGERLLAYVAKLLEQTKDLQEILSSPRFELREHLEKRLLLEKETRERAAELERQMVSEILRKNPDIVFTGLSSVAAADLAKGLRAQQNGLVYVFIKDGEGFQYIITSATTDVRQAAKALNEAFDGRGGGSSELARGRVLATEERILAWLR